MPLRKGAGMRVSLQDVARDLGVSASTVSRALAGHARIGEATRARVRARAEAMGYRPDPVLSAIAGKRWGGRAEAGAALACVALGGPLDRRDPRLRGARAEAERLGYGWEVFTVDGDVAEARVQRVLKARGIHGVVFRFARPEARLPRWNWHDFAVVSLGEPPGGERVIDYVCSALTESHEAAYEEALKRGWRRPGVCLIAPRWLNSERKRMGGIAAAALRAGHAPPPVYWLEPGREDAGRGLAAWVRAEGVDGVLGQSLFVFERMRSARLRPGCDFIALQLPLGDTSGLAGVEVDFEAIGRATVRHVDMLLRQRRHGLPERPTETLVAARWKDGRSLAPGGL